MLTLYQTTKFTVLADCKINVNEKIEICFGKKSLDKEKMLETSIFSFSQMFSKSFFFKVIKEPWFLRVCSLSLLKTLWEKENLLVTSNFSFSYSVFNPFEELSSIFIKFEIVVCKLFQFGRV